MFKVARHRPINKANQYISDSELGLFGYVILTVGKVTGNTFNIAATGNSST